MEIVGICGFIGSGKTTAANHLVANHGFTRMSFAKAVKDITAITFGWDRKKLEGSTPDDRAWREVPDAFWSNLLGRNITPRIALQFIGTNVFRDVIHEDIWANMLMAQIRNADPNSKIVIDDARFINELQAIEGIPGGRLLFLRPDVWPSAAHAELWQTALNDSPAEITRVAEASKLHPSEWDWMRYRYFGVIPTIVNVHGQLDTFIADVDRWYTTGSVPVRHGV